jgi:xanthine phosphoribosyltransferase
LKYIYGIFTTKDWYGRLNTMELLKQRIIEEGMILSDEVLNLDGLLNHQVDPQLTMEMGREFAARFRDAGITRVITVESSGIAVGFTTAYELGVPLVFARRKKTLLADPDAYCERVPSFTKGIVTDIMLSRRFINSEDRVLFIDDIIANGDAAKGLIKIIERSGAELIGLGIVVEKSFQSGARTIREQGIRVESLVKIASLTNGTITFIE